MIREGEQLLVTREDYLAGELVADRKHEYVAGHVYAMAGGSANHDTIAGNFRSEAGSGLKGKPCRPFGSDFLVWIPLTEQAESFYYPDGMIVCEPVAGADRYTDKPVVILEVLSDSTRRIDEVQKLRNYFRLPSLQVYLLAEAEEPTIRVYRRNGDEFKLSLVHGMEETLALPEVGLELPLRELYRDVEFSTDRSA